MTNNLMQPKPLADSAAADSSVAAGRSTKARSTDPSSASPPSTQGALLRALLAGAVALLVLLLPGQLAASRADVAALSDAQLESGRASPDVPSRSGSRGQARNKGRRHVLITMRRSE